ncbi:amino acid adenylation domain-containing protein [Micromonospora sp. SL4-19]|uniref:amino acid adenylation domain-containing protein n=1 Tax=Micromonospora sp. SL4-19 TaxID=3399129 RepID=UPI003A4D6080
MLSAHKAALLDALRQQRGAARRPRRISRRDPSDRAPLSSAQLRLWYLDQTVPDRAAYLLPLAYRLVGPLDTAALRDALTELVRRHETLRTTFTDDGGEPAQVVAAPAPVDLPVVDRTAVDPGDRAADVEARLAAEAATPIDLAAGPLRAHLLAYAPAEHVLLLTLHHVVADEWSLTVLHRELAEAYAAHRDGRPVDLPELPVQYADYALWQRDWLAGPECATQLGYWRQALRDAPAVLDLPTDRPRPVVPSSAGRTLTRRVAVAPEAVRALARRLETTPYVVLLAAFHTLLSRWTGQRDVVVGAAVANRGRTELEGLIGFLVNTVPIRAELRGDATFAAAVAGVRAATLDAHTHQDLPFERMVEALRPQRRPDHNPLFQVMFLHADSAADVLRLPDLAVTTLRPAAGTAKFDLTLAVRDDADALEVLVEYRTDLFDDDTMARLAGHYETLLAGAVAAPDTPLAALPLLTGDELRQLDTWNDTTVADAAATVPEVFAARVRATPDAVAVVDPVRSLTYRDLDGRADTLAATLRAAGVRRGDLVALCLPRGAELAVALLAVLKAGAAYVPLDPDHPPARLRLIAADARAAVVITTAALRDRVPAATVVEVDGVWEAPVVPPAPVPVGPEDLAYVIHTSGSTGRPKGVMVTHRGVVNYARWAGRAYRIGVGDRAPVHSSVAFDLTVTSLLVPLLAGGTAELLPTADGVAGLGEALRHADRPYGLVKITPAHLEIVAGQLTPAGAAGRTDLFVIGGENLLAEKIAVWREHAPGTRLVNEYGPTETVVGCATYEVDVDTAAAGPVPIGRPIDNTRLYVLDAHLRQVPVGATGELYVGGGGVARGYLGRPDLTAERFLPDPYAAPGARMYRTGDLARRRLDGTLEFLGRRDGQVKLHGYRIELGEVEAALTGRTGVAAAAVLLREDRPGDRRLVGYVVPEPGGTVEPATLRAALLAELPEHLVPSALVVLDRLPLTGNGKVDTAALPPPATTVAAEAAPPAGPLAQRIAAVWRDVLGVERVGPHDNFFDLGGHSMLLLRVHRALRDVVGDRVTVTDLFRHPTVHALAAYLERAADAPPGAPAPVATAPAATPTRSTAVAIVAMACRFPEADSPEAFWATVHAGRDVVRPLTDEEILADGEDPALLADPQYVRAAAPLADIDRFDATVFGYTAREAEILDPQQRLFLECAWEALERAGYDGGPYGGPVGVFAGSGRSTYLTENLLTAPEIVRSVGEYQLTLSTDKDFLATRVSYKLNLRGPSISVNTACSTSLVAVHLARQALLAGECDIALAGGASVTAAQRRGYLYRPGDIASPDGHCRPFDAAAAGTIGSSGAGVVALKRLDDAIADGDTIHAVLLGSAINNDGARKVGYTAPGVDGQAEVIGAALDAAGVSARTVGYVEAHGTGTVLGDPVEVAALTQAYRRHTSDVGFCAIGSVKASIGHTDAAAGIAGLIKAVLAVDHATLPPMPHVTEPNPGIPFGDSPFYLPTDARPWPAGPRRAGVSSFGIGGTNAHVVLEQAPQRPPAASAPDDPHLLVLSAADEPALAAGTDRLAGHLRDHPEQDLADIAATLHLGRRALTHRRVLVARDTADAADALAAGDRRRLPTGTVAATPPSLAFVFPGQGAQYVGMGAGLYRDDPGFRAVVDRCAETLHPTLDRDLRELLYPAPHDRERAHEELRRTEYAQPALFVTGYALADVLERRGVVADALAGHSIGEYVAACRAGVFDLDDALPLVAARGRLMRELPPGAMVAVSLTEAEVRPLLGDVCLAAVNAPNVCVLAGAPEAVADLTARLRERRVAVTPVPTSHAFHSALTEPVVPAFVDLLRAVPLRAPRRRYLSNLTGTWITPEEATDPAYWGRHLRRTVRFADCARQLVEAGAVVLEAGPGRALTTLLRQAGAPAGHVVPLLRRPAEDRDDREVLLEGIGRAWLRGATVDWAAFHADRPHRRVPLPTYPFQRRRYWVDRRDRPRPAVGPAAAVVADPALVVDPAPVAEPAPSLGAAHERPALSTGYVAPRDAVEAKLAALFEELFGVRPVGVHDDFFELGGHSLLATQLLARVRADAPDVTLAAVFDSPTVAGLAVLTRAATPAAAVEPTAAAAGTAPATAKDTSVRDGGEHPVSAGQRRLWFLDQAHPDNAAYTIAMAVELDGPLDRDALHGALDEILRRHEVLRTVFPAPDGEPVQRVLPPTPVPLSVVDVTGDDPDGQVRTLLREEGRRRFDLAAGPLFRTTLFRLADDRHVLSLNMHHIVSDGWSLGVLRRELGTLYDDLRAGRAPSLPPLRAQYADHTRVDADPDGLAYWLDELRGAPAALELPTDRPRPPVQSFAGGVVARLLPAELADRLRELSRRHGATLYMTVLAALQTLLYRYTGQRDLCVGTPVAGRTRTETEPLVGFFVNTVVLRTRLDGDLAFADLLTRVRRTALGAQMHQEVPFEALVDALDVPRDVSRNPLFQVLVNLMNLPDEDLTMTGLRVRRLPLDLQTAQVDLALYAYETDAGLDCRFEYDSALFEPATVDRMLGHLHTVLAAVADDPTIRLDDVAVLTPAERHRQLDTWNDTVDDRVPAGTVADLVAAQAARTPDRVAVTGAGRSLTYRDLDVGADRLAGHLRSLGVGPEVLVAVALDRSPEMLVALLAVLKAGGAYLPLDPMYPAERQRYILDHAGARVLVTQRSLAGRYDDVAARRVVVDGDRAGWGDVSGPAAGPDNAAYVLYTSGSTGRPKGVRVAHRSMVNLLHAVTRRVGIAADDRLVAITTIAFDISVLELFGPLTAGARVVVAGRDDAYDGRRLAALLDAEGATVLQATPATWRLLLGAGWTGSPQLTALTGGEALPPALARELTARVGRLWNLYGPTETTIYSTGTEITADTAPITIGHPLANTRAYVLDTRRQPVPVGVAGELYLGGAGLARDYLGQPDVTADRFVPDPFGPPGGRLYRTGDLARHRPDGSIEFLGRNDFQVKVRGYRIELGEIESLLQAHPAVRQAAVVVRDDDGEPQLVAYLVVAGDDPGDWRAHLRTHLPEYMVPSAFVVLPEFPLTPNGKLDRRALPAPGPVTVGDGAEAAPPRTELEATIAARWAEVLRVDAIGIDDNFFDLGGDSFKAVRAVSGLGGSVGVLDIFKHPTVRALAAHMGDTDTGERTLLHRLTPPRPVGTTTGTLVCVPFAGAGAITFRSLAEAAPADLDVYALDPPGHDVNRPDEPAPSLPELVAGCVEEITATITGPVTIYGHCMGGATAVDLARRLEERGVDLVRVVIGGHFPAPPLPGRFLAWLRRTFPTERWTSKRQALEFLRAVGFFTEELTEREKDFIMGVFLHDAREGEDFYARAYADPEHRKIAAPILCVVGESDRVTELYEERYHEWGYFSDTVDLAVIPYAGHYFHNHQAAELVEIIRTGPATPVETEPAPRSEPAPAPPVAAVPAVDGPARVPDRGGPPPTPPRPAARPGPAPSLRLFLLVALGQFVSLVGTGLTTFAMGLWVYQRTGSITLFATTAVLALLPAVFLAPVAGALADRWNKRLMIAAADTLAATGTVTLAALLWTDRLQLWHLFTVVTLSAIATAFQQPAYLAAITQLVPKRYYGRANGLAQLGSGSGTILGPLLGGALAAAIGLRGVVLIDLATFLFAVTVTLSVRFPNSGFKKREEPFLQEILGGWRYISRRHGLVAIIAFTAALNFLFGMIEVLATPLTLSMAAPTVLGMVLAASGAGLVVGAVGMSVWGGTRRRVTGILASFALIGASMVVIGLHPHPLFPALGLFGMGLATAVLNTHWLALVQTKVGLELQGRVIATTLMLSWLMVPAGFLSAGPLAGRMQAATAPGGPLAGAAGLLGAGPGRGIALLVVLAGLLTILLGLVAYRYRPVRTLEDVLPDAIPDRLIVTDKNRLQELADARLAAEPEGAR